MGNGIQLGQIFKIASSPLSNRKAALCMCTLCYFALGVHAGFKPVTLNLASLITDDPAVREQGYGAFQGCNLYLETNQKITFKDPNDVKSDHDVTIFSPSDWKVVIFDQGHGFQASIRSHAYYYNLTYKRQVMISQNKLRAWAKEVEIEVIEHSDLTDERRRMLRLTKAQ